MTGCDCGGNAHNEEHADDCAGWRLEVERLREAAEKAVARCSYGCQPGSYCGRCEPLLAALAGRDKP